ncbi:hypothetical protein BDV95DRAFT_235795 [Massariosphaeria phaeospora]|uniref:Uncharacterized protein n=1 Tax=Massariosphaeria phaeospora TaxID=100035 RepID=A0A7C8MTV0_9PLEO|nr:hypothetical protein BDV95DRAFT_235795 [Massariosphaeria phaeospora]
MATLDKVTSMTSASTAPTPPNPTPRTEAQDGVDSPPAVDFAAVGHMLVPIQEQLNESAYDDMYPSPPVNTPEAFSPAPSVYKPARGRGFSVIGDRLASLKLEQRTAQSTTDAGSSTRSVVPSVSGHQDDDDGAEDDGNLSSSGTIPVALNTPAPNPNLDEYLTFKTPRKHHREESVKSQSGVSEVSNWAEDVEEKLEIACLKLEQLAEDEHNAHPGKSAHEHFLLRLKEWMGNAEKRKYPVDVKMLE